tara:strand:+ start:62 stop:271 length:210 start_codon:yes stop_codon:yes gene_type:complete
MFINIGKKFTDHSARARLIRRCRFSENLDKYSQYFESRKFEVRMVYCFCQTENMRKKKRVAARKLSRRK